MIPSHLILTCLAVAVLPPGRGSDVTMGTSEPAERHGPAVPAHPAIGTVVRDVEGRMIGRVVSAGPGGVAIRGDADRVVVVPVSVLRAGPMRGLTIPSSAAEFSEGE